MILEYLATLSAGIFAGAALYVSFVEHPARLSTGTESALKEFGPSYHRGALMQASLSMIGFALALAAWVQSHELTSLVGALLLAAPFPYTLAFIAPTNRQLLAPDLDATSALAEQLLRRWGHLHAGRTVFGTCAFVVLLWGALAA